MRGLPLLTLLVIAAIVSFVIFTAYAVVGEGGAINTKALCMVQGGVPIVDKDGRLTNCDFPVNIHR